MRYYLLDRITEMKPPESATGLKAVALSEDYFTDHFPQYPIMPGALMLEAMAQLAGALLEESARKMYQHPTVAALTLVERAKFRLVVRPGDLLQIDARVTQLNEEAGRANATAKIGDRVATSATLVFIFRPAGESIQAEQARMLVRWNTPGHTGGSNP